MRSVDQITAEIKSIWDGIDSSGREPSITELRNIEKLLELVEQQKRVETLSKDLGVGGPTIHFADPRAGFAASGAGPGDRFVQSAGYKSVQSRRGQQWSTGLVEVTDGPPFMQLKAGTLLEGAQGAGLIPGPQVAPGVVTQLATPLTFEQLLLGGQATTSSIRFVSEGTATSGAAGVAESGVKPASDLSYSVVDETVKKIATSLTFSDEIMDDVNGLTQFVGGRLMTFVQDEVERQLFRGTAGGNEVQGIFTSRSVPVFTAGTADTRAEQLFKAFNSMRGSALLEPEFAIVHPTDYQVLRLLKDTTNQYLGSGPFAGGSRVRSPARSTRFGPSRST